MPDTFDRVLFQGEFDPTEFNKGVDGMISSLKKAQEQGTVSNETLQKMQGAIDGVTVAATELQKVTGKGIAPSLNDGKLVGQISNIGAAYDNMGKTVSKSVDIARSKVNELVKSQETYKNSIKFLNDELKFNEKRLADTGSQLRKLVDAGKAASAEAAQLRKEISQLTAANTQLNTSLNSSKTSLGETTAQLKIQNIALKDAEAAGNGFTKGLSSIFGGLRKIAYVIPGIGIAGLISLIVGPLIDAFTLWYDNITKVSDKIKLMQINQQNLNGITEAAHKQAGEQITDLKLLYEAATNTNLPMKERLAAVKALQNEFPEYFKNIKSETILNGDAKDSYDKLTDAIIKQATALAAIDKLKDIERQKLDIDFQKDKIRNATQREIAAAQAKTGTGSQVIGGLGVTAPTQGLTRTEVQDIIKNRRDLALAVQNANRKSLQDQEDFIKKTVGISALAKGVETTVTAPKAEKQRKEIENIYEQELQKLRADIAKLDEKGFTDEGTITKAIEEDFKKRDLGFQKAFKNKQLTAGQLASLQENLKNLQQLTLDKALKDFNVQKAEYLQKINDAIESLQNEESLKRISTIQDNFERERQTIIAESNKTISSLAAARDRQIADITKNAGKNGLTAAQIQPQIDQIKTTYGRLLDDLGLIREQKLQKLAFDTFEKLSEDARRLLDSGNLDISQGSLINIKAQTDLFLRGRISYEQYQKALTAIARAEAQERFNIDKLFLQQEIKIRQDRLAVDKSLTDDQIKKLQDEIRRLQQQLADAEKGNAITSAGNQNADTNSRIDNLVKYAQAIQNVAQSVIGFWQQANEAERQALDRSIALQDRRVESARNIAARGNAEYLRLEEERQQKLLIQQENAARRTLAINAALQASQIIVALISGIAQGAKIGGGLGAIVEVGAVVAALAGAYAIAQSLKPPQPSFFVGTEDTGPAGNVDSKGGKHAIIHPHERILTAEENKKLKGISNKQLIEVVNQHKVLVENWRSKPDPQLNFAAMDMATQVSNTQNIRLAGIMEDNNRELKENNALHRQTHRYLKSMGVSVNFDANGVAVMVREVSERIEKSKKL